MLEKEIRVGLTYDDVVLVPARSHVLPSEVDTRTRLSRNIQLNIPIVSAAMDTVTEARLAIAMAQEGGIGIVHRVLSPVDQAAEIDKVKKSESGMILDPITISPDQTIRDAYDLMARYRISGIPVTKGGKLVGILTNRDLRFETRMELKVSQVMKRDKLITAPEGTSLEKAREILHEHRIEKLPVVNKQFELKGLITIKDIEKRIKYPHACKDSHGRLRVGAALGVGPETGDRVALLVKVGVDVVVVDTAHGHSQAVLDTVKMVRKAYPQLDIIAGNIAHRAGGQGFGEGRGGRSQSGRGTRINLYDPDGVRCGYATTDRYCRLRQSIGRDQEFLSLPMAGSSTPAISRKPWRPARRRLCWAVCWPGLKKLLVKPCCSRPGPTRCIAEWGQSEPWNEAAVIGMGRRDVPHPSWCRKALKAECQTRGC